MLVLVAEKQEKQDEIRRCLQGNSEEQVDLWNLRQLALSRGGLAGGMRKCAWPKLMGILVMASHDCNYYYSS